MKVTIWHKPNCATSRTVLAALRAAGHKPKIVDYLAEPLSSQQLLRLANLLKVGPRGLLRRKEPLFAELGLDDEKLSDEQLVDIMLAHPILIDRPVVIVGQRAVLARPPEKLLELIPTASAGIQKKDRKVAAGE